MKNEIWKKIKDFPDYEISNCGRVKSFKCAKEKILEPFEDDNGYSIVSLSKKGEKPKTIRIYILMVEGFIGEIPKGYVVHHKDFTKNNFMDNFQMITRGEHSSIHNKRISEETRNKQSETRKEKFRNGELNLKGENNPMFGSKRAGEKSGNHILTEQDVIKIWKLLDKGILTQREIGEKFGVNQAQISKIKRGERWSHIKLEIF